MYIDFAFKKIPCDLECIISFVLESIFETNEKDTYNMQNLIRFRNVVPGKSKPENREENNEHKYNLNVKGSKEHNTFPTLISSG